MYKAALDILILVECKELWGKCEAHAQTNLLGYILTPANNHTHRLQCYYVLAGFIVRLQYVYIQISGSPSVHAVNLHSNSPYDGHVI